MRILKQSTAVTPKVGPFLDSTDGITAETALTISQSDCLLSKAYGSFAQKNDTSSATHDAGGWYAVPLNTTDTNTLGPLQLSIQESGAVPVFEQWLVVPANVYDSLVSTDKLQVDAVEVNSTSAAAARLALSAGVILPGTVDNTAHTPTSTEFEADDITEATADHFVGRVIVFTSGALLYQATRIEDYSLTGGRGHFTVTAMTEAPANNDTFVIV